jgi:hypothetical protein
VVRIKYRKRRKTMSSADSKRFLWILLLAALLLTAIVASATTLQPMSFAQLTRQATAIVQVRCVSVQSVWVGGEIWTDSRFAVLRQEKTDAYGNDQYESGISARAPDAATQGAQASSTETITVRLLGGSVAGIHSQVDDVPQFHPGEEAYLFLWRRAREPYRVLGWTQGTFRVRRDERTGAARVSQDSAMAAFHEDVREYQSSGMRNVPLAAFREKLRAAIAATTTGVAGAANEK